MTPLAIQRTEGNHFFPVIMIDVRPIISCLDLSDGYTCCYLVPQAGGFLKHLLQKYYRCLFPYRTSLNTRKEVKEGAYSLFQLKSPTRSENVRVSTHRIDLAMTMKALTGRRTQKKRRAPKNEKQK